MTRLSGFLPVLALAASVSPLLSAEPAHDKSQVVVPADSLVRVIVEREASAIMLGDGYQTRQKILSDCRSTQGELRQGPYEVRHH